MTFEELRDTIIANAKAHDICAGLNRARVATNYAELIESGAAIIEWSYQAGVVPDDLIAEFPESDLNTAGIYSTGSVSLTNPTGTIYALKDVDMTVSFTEPSDCNIVGMGNATITINGSSSATGSIAIYDEAILIATLTEDSFLSVLARNLSHYEITLEDSAMLKVAGYESSDGELDASGTTTATINLWNEAIIHIAENDSAAVKTYLHSQTATITRPET